jgi:hypothetical protein
MATKKTGKPPGRPKGSDKDDPAFAAIAQQMCRLGATDLELARAFNVTTVTIWRWQSRHPDFCNALKTGKEIADQRVERSLYQRAVGYSFDSEKLFSFEGSVTRAGIVEHVPPDVGAAKHWLSNRKPQEWHEKQEIEHRGDAFRDFLAFARKAGSDVGPPNPHKDLPDA